ncbi:MAG: hypothetical protein WCO43_09900 [Chitinophagia bacterium]
MKVFKFIILIIVLTQSCTNNKTKPSLQETQSTFVDTIRKSYNNFTQEEIDSNYIEYLKDIEENPYSDNFDTLIKGGFSISFYHDKELQYLLYKKGNKVIDTIGSCSLGLPYKNLGYIGADFDSTFVFVNSFGKGNPHYIWLYDKVKMKNLIPEGGAMIDADIHEQVLLYSKIDVPVESNGDKMTLFDTRNMTQKDYAFPGEIFNEPEKLNRIRLTNVTDETFTIEYNIKDGTITRKKKYSR